MANDTSGSDGPVAGPSSQPAGSPLPSQSTVGGMPSPEELASDPNVTDAQVPSPPPFYHSASTAASSTIASIRSRYIRFPTPILKIQRVNQLDAELLDRELAELLLILSRRLFLPSALLSLRISSLSCCSYSSSHCSNSASSIEERATVYAAKPQIPQRMGAQRRTAEHRPGPTSVSTATYVVSLADDHRPVRGKQMARSHDITQLLGYAEQRPSPFALETDGCWTASLVCPGVGELCGLLGGWQIQECSGPGFRNEVDVCAEDNEPKRFVRVLESTIGVACVYRVLLFLLPLVRPKRLFRRLMKLPTHPKLLAAVWRMLPLAISTRLGIRQDATGRTRFSRDHVSMHGQRRSSASRAESKPTRTRKRIVTKLKVHMLTCQPQSAQSAMNDLKPNLVSNEIPQRSAQVVSGHPHFGPTRS